MTAKASVGERQDVYNVIGKNPLRHDGTDKVTGRAQYGADIRLPGMLYGAILRSPHAHALILSIDTRKAEVYPGVKAVVTANDLPDVESKIADLGEGTINLRHQSHNVLAKNKALYFGHAIAAVAAVSPHVAQEAAALIDVKYEILPPVLDVRKAMQPDSPVLLDDMRTDELGKKGDHPSNVAAHSQHQTGNVDKGFQNASVIVEREFLTSMVHQGYIEPQNATAQYNPDGQVTIWCSTQGAFGVREQVAEILEIPISKIRVIPMEIGGGFGGKIGVYLEPVVVLLSRKSGYRPVKMTMSRSDVLAATGPTSGSYINVKMGADANGRITAARATLVYEAGAFPESPVGGGMGVIFAPYRIENALVDGYDVLVNKPRTAAYRAPGGTNAAFACETVIDELSEKLGMDPIEFRLLNGVKEGDRRVDGPVYRQIGFVETLEAARDSAHYKMSWEGPNRGRGVASGFWFNYGGKSSASASVNSDGTVSLLTGSVDIGGTRTSIAMQLAEGLGIPAESIRPVVADTDSVGYTEGTYGSRTTFATGWAVYEISKQMKEKLKERAAAIWETELDQIRLEDGIFSCADKQMTFAELASRLDETGGAVVASASVQPEKSGPAFATHIVDVEIDPETGKVQILRYTAVQDVGKAIYPDYVKSQMQGGVAQGVGWALNEEYLYDDQGRLINASLLDYRMPIALDLPMIDTVIVEVPNPGHPYGVRGVGEVPIVPPPAALANAIYHAVGVRMNRLPMKPARIVAELNRQKG
ncbi:MAG TPA: xanthine dehydrogenase family protein molybdopterin-binding subunit [Anaerolineales bacterium]|nr:xanthine dehydrogenase family protein molybdopterin-binding subunit [Anaerolineales bacterium]